MENQQERIRELIEAAIRDHCQGADLWMASDLAAQKVIELIQQDTSGVQETQSQQWRGLTKDEIDHEVGQLVEYGTEFVAPLYAVVEGIERKLRERNAGVGGQGNG